MRAAVALSLLFTACVAYAQSARSPAQFVNSPEVKTPTAVYSQAVVVTGGKLVYVAGQVGFDKEGKMPADFRGQVQGAFNNLKLVLAAAGAKPENVVKLNYYVVGLTQEKRMALRAAREQFTGSGTPPASTLAGVAALAQEDIQVEIEAVAVVP